MFQTLFLECSFKKNVGIDCLGCGFQRSIFALLHGNLQDSIRYYLPTVPLIILWIFVILHLFFKFKKGALIIKYLFLICAVLIIINYILKFI